ncbi:putative bifunctional diguanylate cyclase/phosphodiesterase [Cryptosporangium sp. NPDC048952]|uniref:putative bifunctional diguanylate cyclase/phosphodiesterase n=1 Tax=Cryptosporangium sp. NPDC048952 TaxID=3363961 RepID=UPI0037118B12
MGRPLAGALPLFVLPLVPVQLAVSLYAGVVLWLILTTVQDQVAEIGYAAPGAPMTLIGITIMVLGDGALAVRLSAGGQPDPFLAFLLHLGGLATLVVGLVRLHRALNLAPARGGLIDLTVVGFGIGTSVATLVGTRVVVLPSGPSALVTVVLLAVISLAGWVAVLRLVLVADGRTETGLLVASVGLLLISSLVWWGPLFDREDPGWALTISLAAGVAAATASRWWVLHGAGVPSPPAGGSNSRLPLFLVAVVAPPIALTISALTNSPLDPWRNVVVPVAGMAVLSIALLLRVHQQATDSRVRALRDALTGLANRAALTDALAALPSGSRPALLLLDLDGFKAVNDGFGHPAGDALLRLAADRLAATVAADATAAATEAVVARLGGDEFAILLCRADRAGAVELGRRIVEVVARPYPVDERELCVTASVGVRVISEDLPDGLAGVLLRDADLALYSAKQNGKNQVSVFSPVLRAAHAERAALAAGLHEAVTRNEFVLHYQPSIDVVTGRATVVEALIRWAPPGRDPVPSRDFLPVAEAAGLSVPIGTWALRTACVEARPWFERYGVGIAVNVSERLLLDPGLLELVRSVLDDSGLPPHALVLELTESAVTGDTAALASRIVELRGSGVRIAVDDFGTGQSSLALLRQIPVDVLKLDPALGRAAALDTSTDALVDAALTRAVLEICRTLGLRAVAERVESADRVEWLRDLGCRLMQGNYFTPPLPAADLDSFLAAHSGRLPVLDTPELLGQRSE